LYLADLIIDNNTYHAYNTTGDVIHVEQYDRLTWAEWQALGLDLNSTITATGPTGLQVFVMPTDHEEDTPFMGRFVVYNWDEGDDVDVDLSSLGLLDGVDYNIKNALDYFSAPAVYQSDGSDTAVSINMSNQTIENMGGTWGGTVITDPLWPSPYPTFGAFIVEEA
jgi:hypothetical protein